MAKTIVIFPTPGELAQLIQTAPTPNAAAMAFRDKLESLNPHVHIQLAFDETEHVAVPLPAYGGNFRPTPESATYDQLAEALRPFADCGRDYRVENARVYKASSFPTRREQIMSVEFSGPALLAMKKAAETLYGSPPETPPSMPKEIS